MLGLRTLDPVAVAAVADAVAVALVTVKEV